MYRLLPDFLDTLLVQNCIENSECDKLTTDSKKKHEFISLDQVTTVHKLYTICEYLQQYKADSELFNIFLCNGEQQTITHGSYL